MEYFNSITDFLFIVTMVLLGQVHSKFFDTARGFSRDGLNVNVHICLVVTKFSCLGFHWLWIHWKEGCMYMLEGCLPFFFFFLLYDWGRNKFEGKSILGVALIRPSRTWNAKQDLQSFAVSWTAYSRRISWIAEIVFLIPEEAKVISVQEVDPL